MLPKFLVLTGDGINCERETARAFVLAGAEAEIVHINDLLKAPEMLEKFQGLAFPGGFSFGDDLGSGQVLGVKLRHGLGDHLRHFVEAGAPIIGICNGFQALVKLGLLPLPFSDRVMALAENRQGHFLDRWVDLEVDANSPCVWTRGLINLEEKIQLPIRHGEGRIVFQAEREEVLHNQFANSGQFPLRYKQDINGSHARIAGVCDPKGLIFGLMPHPEAAVSKLLYPNTDDVVNRSDIGIGLRIFQSCVNYLKEK